MQQDLLETVLNSESIDTSPHCEISSSVKRVAILTEAFLPKVDGVSRTALLTIKYLENTGRKVIVFAPGPAPKQISRTPIYAIPSLWLPFYSETRVAPPWPFILRRLKAFVPDMIHLFSPFALGTMGMIAGERLNVPVIANYQTDLPAYTRSYGFPFLWSTFVGLLRFIHNGSTLTLAPSPATLNEIRSWGFRRLRLWGRGVDTQRFNPAHRTNAWRARLLAGRNASRMVVLYVGRLAKEKHLETLYLIATDRRYALTLVGGGNYQPELEKVFAESDVNFTGYLIGDDLANAFAAADVFVFPGPEETFGQVVLEAMASALPVIVTDRGGPATLVQNGVNGYVCPTDDANAFANYVARLYNDPQLRRQMSAAARASAELRPWLAIMGQLEMYYEEATRLHHRLARWRNQD